MNSTERIMAILQGNPVDRSPIILVTSLYGSKYTKGSLQEYYTNATLYAQGQRKVYDLFHSDIVFSPFVMPYFGAAFGSAIDYLHNQPPNIVKPIASTAEQFFMLPLPNIDEEKHLLYVREAVRNMVQDFKSEVPIAAILLSPMDWPTMIFGIEGWMDILYSDTTSAHRIIDTLSELFVSYANALFNDGATCIILPIPFANLRIITPKILKDMVIPCFENIFSQLNGPVVLHHVGLPFNSTIKLLRGLPNVIGYVLDPKDSLEEARAIVGDEPILFGNIDGSQIFGLDELSIKESCTRILTNRSHDSKFIFTTSAADIDLETTESQLEVVVSTVQHYNKKVYCG